jgi:hypothetical protein
MYEAVAINALDRQAISEVKDTIIASPSEWK